ncbi:MAG: methylmalonyl-CoA mutase family protein [Bacteroidota bacterium]
MNSSDRLREAYREWETSTYRRAVEERKERQPEFHTASFMPVNSLYTPLDRKDDAYLEDVGFPGEFPFTRGIQPSMYRGKLWTMRQYAGFGTARESNERFRYLLAEGQSGLSVAFDLPTQIGYDSDAPIADGEVGRVGVAIDTLADMETLFDGIPLDRVSTSMTINAPAAILLAMYIALAKKQGVPARALRGTIQNDILKEYIARGTYIFPPRPSMRLITNTFEYCARELPKWNAISVSGYHIREAGSTAAQEVGFTLANGIAYLEAAIRSGLDVDAFAGQVSFFFNAHNDLLEEVAKFRAARRLWARTMKDRFNARNERSLMLRFHAQTAGSTLTAQQPDNNIVRVAIQTLAAVLGGAQSLHTNSRDEALALPTEESVRIALRTQQIVAFESGVTNTVDPVAGSYYVESLTDHIEQEALEYIRTIDGMGGVPEAIESGYIQREIQKAAYRHSREVEEEKRIVVGVNRYQTEDEEPEELLKIDRKVQADQIASLVRVREGRASGDVDERLSDLEQAARGSENLLPFILEAVRVYATVGEICDRLREVFGEYRETIVV